MECYNDVKKSGFSKDDENVEDKYILYSLSWQKHETVFLIQNIIDGDQCELERCESDTKIGELAVWRNTDSKNMVFMCTIGASNADSHDYVVQSQTFVLTRLHGAEKPLKRLQIEYR